MNENNNQEYVSLKLENQLCFPLYACSKEIVRRYTPYLKPLGITYTQYITMMVLWEHPEITVGELGQKLFLDSGTLTPLLHKLESMGYVTRERSAEDERVVIIKVTDEGLKLREQAKSIPAKLGADLGSCVGLKPEEAAQLYGILYKIIEGFRGEN